MDKIVTETIESYNEYLLKIPDGIAIILNLISEKEYKNVVTSVKNLVEGLLWMNDVNKNLLLLGFKNTEDFSGISVIIGELTHSLENLDYNLCGDILNYDLNEFLNKLKKIDLSEGLS